MSVCDTLLDTVTAQTETETRSLRNNEAFVSLSLSLSVSLDPSLSLSLSLSFPQNLFEFNTMSWLTYGSSLKSLLRKMFLKLV